MTELLEEFMTVDWGVFFGGLALIVTGYPIVKKQLEDFETNSGFQFPWTTKRNDLKKRFNDMDTKIEEKYAELENRIKSIHETEHKEQEAWHNQSITIRDNIIAEQNQLEKNQEEFVRVLGNISASLEEIKSDFLDERLERKRWNILNCATQLRNENKIDIEQFNNVFRDYDSYEKLITSSGRSNGLIEESIKFIREKYQDLLNNEN